MVTNIEEINVFAAEIAVEIVKDAGLQDKFGDDSLIVAKVLKSKEDNGSNVVCLTDGACQALKKFSDMIHQTR